MMMCPKNVTPQTLGIARSKPYRLAVWSYDHATWVLVVAAILIAASVPWIRSLRIDMDFSSLLDKHDPLLDAFSQGKSRFGESNPLFVIVTPKGQAEVDSRAFEAGLRDRLKDMSDVRFLSFWQLNPSDVELAAARVKAALLNQRPEKYQSFLSRIDPSAMEREIRKTRRKLISLNDPDLRQRVAIDVLGVVDLTRPFLEDRVSESAIAFLDSGTADAGVLLMAVRPSGSAEDSQYCLGLMSRLETACLDTARDLNLLGQLEFSFAGLHALTAQSTQVLQLEMVQISLMAGGLLLGLLWIALRRLPMVLICFLPLIASMVLLLDLARAFFNPIYFITIGFVAIVLGLGLDVSVHLMGRLVQFMDSRPIRDALGSAQAACARPLAAGIGSTAAAFLALLFTGKDAMIQFGLLTAAGLVLTLSTTFVLFPALVRVLVSGRRRVEGGTIRLLPLRFFAFFCRHRRWSFAAGIILVGLCLPWAFRFRFDMTLTDFFARHLPSMEATEELEKQIGTAFTSTFQVHVATPDFETAIGCLEVLDETLVQMVKRGDLVMFESPSMFFPYGRQPQASNSMDDTSIDRQVFFSLLERYKIKRQQDHETYLEVIDAVINLPADSEELSHILPQSRMLMDPSGNRVRFQMNLWPSAQMTKHGPFSGDPADEFERQLGTMDLPAGAEIAVAGTAHILAAIQTMVKNLFFKVAWISLILVLVVVWLCFRKIAATVWSFVPLLGGIPVMMAGLVILDVPITPTAIAFAAVVFGIGIDDAVHVIARTLRTQNTDGVPVSQAVTEVGPVISLTTASTAIGFGCLAWSSHPVVSSLGVSVLIGVMACWAFTFLLMPMMLSWAPRGRWFGSVVVLLSLLPGTELNGQSDSKRALMRRLENKMAETETVSCKFEQEKKIAQLAGIIELEGTLVFQKPQKFRIEITGEERLLILCDGKGITIVDLDLNETETIEMEELPERRTLLGPFSILFELDPETIEDEYHVSLEKNDAGHHVLKLKPKSIEDPTSGIDITIDRRLRIRQLVWSFENGDYSCTTFRTWRRPKNLDQRLFTDVDIEK